MVLLDICRYIEQLPPVRIKNAGNAPERAPRNRPEDSPRLIAYHVYNTTTYTIYLSTGGCLPSLQSVRGWNTLSSYESVAELPSSEAGMMMMMMMMNQFIVRPSWLAMQTFTGYITTLPSLNRA
ncbi:hypothetical protein N7G274_001710 [Stereocaulon virgatum]|uniref:Uncharacterized protein n=1 Tax=Stereocaulon virgatum TaxID=373712 RepID=A0ABR4AMB5_9LECA